MKLVLVVRADLEMGRGKIAGQVAHAAVAATLASFGGGVFNSWLENGQPKVVLKAPTGEVLNDIIALARAVGLPVQVVHDAGRTQVASGTMTCCAIGPAPDDRVDAVTAGLSLL
jgi:peptidyl-tRNA hydrolase, PTH2 family